MVPRLRYYDWPMTPGQMPNNALRAICTDNGAVLTANVAHWHCNALQEFWTVGIRRAERQSGIKFPKPAALDLLQRMARDVVKEVRLRILVWNQAESRQR